MVGSGDPSLPNVGGGGSVRCFSQPATRESAFMQTLLFSDRRRSREPVSEEQCEALLCGCAYTWIFDRRPSRPVVRHGNHVAVLSAAGFDALAKVIGAAGALVDTRDLFVVEGKRQRQKENARKSFERARLVAEPPVRSRPVTKRVRSFQGRTVGGVHRACFRPPEGMEWCLIELMETDPGAAQPTGHDVVPLTDPGTYSLLNSLPLVERQRPKGRRLTIPDPAPIRGVVVKILVAKEYSDGVLLHVALANRSEKLKVVERILLHAGGQTLLAAASAPAGRVPGRPAQLCGWMLSIPPHEVVKGLLQFPPVNHGCNEASLELVVLAAGGASSAGAHK